MQTLARRLFFHGLIADRASSGSSRIGGFVDPLNFSFVSLFAPAIGFARTSEGGADMFPNEGIESSLFDEFRRLQDEMDELFSEWTWPAGIRSVPRGSFPPMNVGASPEKVEVYLFAPGVDPKKLDIAIQQNLLTVAGERMILVDKDATFYRQERFSGAFRRAVTLPEDVDPDGVDARYRDGVLQISVRRREAARPRQITVQ
jgi:HSP20 family protein